jgi:hypothetical protein
VKSTVAVQTFGVPRHVIGPTGAGVPWLGALVRNCVTSSPSGSVADSVIVTGVSSGVVADLASAAGGSAVSVTVIVNVPSTDCEGVPSSVARTRIE